MLPWCLRNLKLNLASLFRKNRAPLSAQERQLVELLGFVPSNWTFYHKAFRHKSIYPSLSQNNERLEFLGDSVLDLIISEYVFDYFPKRTEGYLTKMRSKIVSRKMLNKLALKLELNTYIEAIIDVKQDQTSLHGNALEALVGAIYRDQGYAIARSFVISKLITPYVDMGKIKNAETDFKSRLLEWSQKTKTELRFETIELPPNSTANFRFEASVIIGDKEVGKATCTSKKRAEQKAAAAVWKTVLNN